MEEDQVSKNLNYLYFTFSTNFDYKIVSRGEKVSSKDFSRRKINTVRLLDERERVASLFEVRKKFLNDRKKNWENCLSWLSTVS